MEDCLSKPRDTRSILIFICLVLFFDAMGVALILPVMPEFIGELSDLPNSRAAAISGYLLFTFAIMQFAFAPILGGLSDRFGRRPVLLLALLGFSIDYFIMAAAPSLFWLFVARALSGLFGATFPAANAAIVDITDPAQRARNFGYIGGAVALGFIFGPAFGGLVGEYGARLPYIISGILTFGVCIYGFFKFPETLPQEKRRRFDWRRANPFGSIISVSRYPLILPLIFSLFLIQFANQSYVSIWSFFTIEVAGWSPFMIGVSAALYGLCMAIVQGGLTGPVIKRTGPERAILFSMIAGMLAFLGLGIAQTPAEIFFWVVGGSLSGFIFPAYQALMTVRVPEDSQGELQGALASSFSLATIIGPLMMSQTFGHFTSGEGVYLPGAAFILAAGLVLASLMVFVLATRK